MRPPNGKRGRSRGRNKGGHHHHGHHNNINRTLESNGPDVKIRGTALHIHEKYLALARDAHSSGDRIAAENYLQHAEHYHRLIASMQPPGQPYQPGMPMSQPGAANGTPAEDEEGGDGAQPGGQGGYPGQSEIGQNFGGPQQNAGGYSGQANGERDYRDNQRSEFRNREPREGGEGRGPREFREHREPREGGENREPRDSGDGRPPRGEFRDRREGREPREAREARQNRGDAPQARSDGEEALAFERRLNGRSRRVGGEDRNGRAITSLERDDASRGRAAEATETSADEADDAGEAAV